MAFPALASAAPGEVTSVQMIHNGDLMTVNLGLDLSGLNLKKDQAAIFTPMLVNGPDTLWLNGVGVYGRTRWYQAERARTMPLGGDGELSLRYHKVMDPVMLSQHVGYQEWMNGSELMLRRADYGCAGCGQGQPVITDIAAYEELRFENPEFFFQEAVAEAVKTREIHGRAYVDFPVNKIVIYPDYRNNTYELGKIIATIDSIKNDPDISVNSLHIAGTASPEGPYDNNVYLAKNRTKALKDYVQNLYKFPEGFITTSYEPVDWAGLREWLENNNLPHKDQILAIVNSDIEPFARNSKIMKDYPEDYEFLLRQVYPALRHSDYIISFTVRQYSDLAEIAQVLRTSPQKLSLSEMYRLAASLEPGSDDYNEVFEVVVRMYPQDETANLNAANTALARGDLKAAERYLAKAGNSPEAIYARGVLAGFKGEYSEGLRLLEEAVEAGLKPNDGFETTMKKMKAGAAYNK